MSRPDLSSVIRRLAGEPVTIHVIRPGDVTYVDGEAVRAASSEFDAQAVVDSRVMGPRTAAERWTIAVWCPDELRYADRIAWKGDLWDVEIVEDYSAWGYWYASATWRAP